MDREAAGCRGTLAEWFAAASRGLPWLISCLGPWLLLALLAAAALPRPAAAEEPGPVVLVLDRSASLRHADPDDRVPREVALGLLLAGVPEVSVLPGDGAPVDLRPGASALPALLAAVSLPRARGGVDLAPILSSAVAAAGERGTVLLVSDDDLDVVGPRGEVPPEVLARARTPDAPRPTRAQVNEAALALLRERFERGGARRGPRLLGLRLPLQAPRGTTTPFLQELGALVAEAARVDLAAARVVVSLVRGEPSAARLAVDARAGVVTLPFPGRVLVAARGAIEVAGGTPCDAARDVWLVTTSDGRFEVRSASEGALDEAVACVLLPEAAPPEALAFALRGCVRVVAAGPLPQGTTLEAVASGGRREGLVGDPPRAQVATTDSSLTLVRTVRVAEQAVVSGRRTVTVVPVDVVLAASGRAEVGRPLELAGELPAGLGPIGAQAVRVRLGGGSEIRVELVAAGGRLAGSFVPEVEGPLTLAPAGLVPVRLAEGVVVGPAAVEVPPLVARTVTLEVADGSGAALEGGVMSVRGDARHVLALRVRVEPPAPAPLPLEVRLRGGPEGSGVHFYGAEAAAVASTVDVQVAIVWPEGAADAPVDVRLEAAVREGGVETVGVLALRAVPEGALPWRPLAGAGVLFVAATWALWLARRRRLRRTAVEERLGARQLRAIGGNGRISFERYPFLQHSQGDSVLIEPDEAQEGGLALDVRPDGSVKATALGGARIVHADRPAVLADEAVLRPGTAFALVRGTKARRYVYLEGDPTPEDLKRRFVADATSYAPEAEAGDSGVFVVLDDDENLASTSARLFAQPGADLFPEAEARGEAGEGGEAEGAAAETGEARILEVDSGDELTSPASSDELDALPAGGSDVGIVVMDSDEMKILGPDGEGEGDGDGDRDGCR